MKSNKIIVLKQQNRFALRAAFLFLLCLLNFSCEKFVDVKPNSKVKLIESVADCQLALNDYNNLNKGYPNDGEASSDNYYLDDNGGYNSPSLSNDDRNLYIWSAGAIRQSANPQWQKSYYIVYLTNLVLESLEDLKGSGDKAILDDLRGQALFFRAYAFWQVAQLYTKPYNSATAGQDLGIPLRLASDINGKSVRGTLQQTYTQITGDLQEAVGLLSSTLVVASRPNKTAAYAMLARVYLSMEDYTQAQNYANLALQINQQLLDYNTIDINPYNTTPFLRFNKEVIFQSLTTNNALLDPGYGYGKSAALIDPQFIGSYHINDLRKQVLFKENISDVDYSTPNGTYRFTGNYEPVSSSTLFNGLAVDEIFLIRAECYARAGNKDAAMADLNTLLATRWVMGIYENMTAATADDALSKVLAERRKELVMRGLRWTDLRRLNKDSRFAVTLSRTVLGTTYTLPPNDLRYTLLIPRDVITNSNIEQNSR